MQFPRGENPERPNYASEPKRPTARRERAPALSKPLDREDVEEIMETNRALDDSDNTEAGTRLEEGGRLCRIEMKSTNLNAPTLFGYIREITDKEISVVNYDPLNDWKKSEVIIEWKNIRTVKEVEK
ncbi:hypothetical protein HY224_03065 [Candidatus Uhrbacteria bacterium]|nr:hypothetical protein [Candidatus Uhrbacteria bacterium]